jgi:O-antigen/teichoic acid export membrane protein
MSEMKSSHLRWSYLSTASTAVMQLAAAVTITRFLQPSDYGLAALAMLCYSMVGYFTQLGVGRVIVQKPELTEGNIRAAFTLGLATGTGGFVILAALSPLLGMYFHEKRLSLVILVFGLNLIFQSLGMVACALLRRDFRIRDLAICDFLGYLLSTFGVGLPMAMHGYGADFNRRLLHCPPTSDSAHMGPRRLCARHRLQRQGQSHHYGGSTGRLDGHDRDGTDTLAVGDWALQPQPHA